MYATCCFSGCVRLASLGRPRSAPVRSNSFEGAHLGQPPVPCLWSGSLGGDLRCMPSPRESECDRSISSCPGLTRVRTAGVDPGKLLTNAPIVSLSICFGTSHTRMGLESSLQCNSGNFYSGDLLNSSTAVQKVEIITVAAPANIRLVR